MPKILLVSPNFPPLIYPDLHRVRTLLPYFADHGWEATVLCLNPYEDNGIKDDLLVQTIPPQIKVVIADQVPPLGQYLIKWIKGRTWRAIGMLVHAGNQIIEREKPDLIYFSTTMFPVMSLGPYWWKRYGVPYLVDWQDPWVSDYYTRTKTKPPGGYLKYGVSQWLGRYLEAEVLRYTNHVVSVSPSYPLMLQSRYPWLQDQQFTVLPFGGSNYDFEILANLHISNPIFDANDGYIHWVYLGRFAKNMHYAISGLFAAIAHHRQANPELWERIKIHFVGTHYDINAKDSPIQNLAVNYNLRDMVQEHPQRIPYMTVLQTMVESDGIIILGSDDQGYTPSKLYPCILSQRAIFAVMHENSSIVDIINQTNSGHVITFGNTQEPQVIIEKITAALPYFLSQTKSNPVNTNWSEFKVYTTEYLAQKHIEIFNQYISAKST